MSDNASATQPRDIALRLRNGDAAVQFMSENHRSCDPLHYWRLFPAGDDGWHMQLLRHVPPSQRASQFVHSEASASAESQRRVTAREYYTYRLQQRSTSSDILFRAQRLFQEFCCFSWVKTETTKLNYLRSNQTQLRAELYNNLRDHVLATDAGVV